MLTEEMAKKVEMTLKNKGRQYYAGFSACVIMDSVIKGTFGATKALIISGAIDEENEDKLLWGFEGENLELLEIFKGNEKAMNTYLGIDMVDRILDNVKVKFEAASAFATMLVSLGILESSEGQYILDFFTEVIRDGSK